MPQAIGIDIGGTSMRAALVTDDGRIIASASRPTGFDTPCETVLANFEDVIGEMMRASGDRGIEGVGIGMPGFQDEQGRVIAASNLPRMNGADLRAEARRIAGVPAVMENDMNMLALGEYHFGGHKVTGNLLVVALGTGVGAALVDSGRLVRVFRGSLGDPGHILVEPGGPECRCGATGCLEAHIASWAIVERAGREGVPRPAGANGRFGPADVWAAAREGDAAAMRVAESVAGWLGMGLASWCALYQPERIVLGGNVFLEGADLLLPGARQRMHRLAQRWRKNIPIEPSCITQTAGMLGAAAIVFHPQ